HYYAQMDKKVLLLELDYRKNPFAEEPQNQKATLVDYLKGDISIEEVTIRGRPDRIRITKNDPSLKELIKSKKMGSFWGSLKEAYDLIIIDTPGAIEDDYTTNLASMADLCILVVGSSQVKKNTIDETVKVLEFSGARPCGIVLNRINPVYVDNARIKLETKRSNKDFLRELLAWRR
ncbi:MAG: tyrosine-protein kinase family protein, partial [Waddliaceae bacterium]